MQSVVLAACSFTETGYLPICIRPRRAPHNLSARIVEDRLVKIYLTKVASGALYGLGFSLVFLISLYVFSKAMEKEGASDYPPELRAEYLPQIEITPDKFHFAHGRIRITGTLRNKTGIGLEQINIVARVSENGTPIEKCTSLADGAVKNNEETGFTIYCSTSWPEINPDSLAAEFQPANVYVALSENR
jgi:hypothetical protein